MAAAPKFVISDRKRQVPSRARNVAALHGKIKPTVHLSGKGSTSGLSKNTQAVSMLASSQPVPIWLRRLCYLQRQSSIVTFVLVAATLTVYGWTVYSQEVWGQAYRKLINLQRDERQLTTTSEVLKNQMALQAQKPATGLMPSNPASAIFLQPAPQRPVPTPTPVDQATSTVVQAKLSRVTPLGY